MRPLRYSINVTLDGCCDHREMVADVDLHRHAVENLDQADALLFGRVTYEMMEAAWRPPARTGTRPDWMEPFACTIGAARKYVVSSTLDRVDWNAELVRGDLGKAVQQLKRASGKGLFVGGVKLPQALAELGLIVDDRVAVAQVSSWTAERRSGRRFSTRGDAPCSPLEVSVPAAHAERWWRLSTTRENRSGVRRAPLPHVARSKSSGLSTLLVGEVVGNSRIECFVVER